MAVPGSVSHGDYFGYSVGRGAFTFPSGEWVEVEEILRLNSPPSEHNGEVLVYINGDLKINMTGVALVTSEEARIQGMMWQTFFGGGFEDSVYR